MIRRQKFEFLAKFFFFEIKFYKNYREAFVFIFLPFKRVLCLCCFVYFVRFLTKNGAECNFGQMHSRKN